MSYYPSRISETALGTRNVAAPVTPHPRLFGAARLISTVGELDSAGNNS